MLMCMIQYIQKFQRQKVEMLANVFDLENWNKIQFISEKLAFDRTIITGEKPNYSIGKVTGRWVDTRMGAGGNSLLIVLLLLLKLQLLDQKEDWSRCFICEERENETLFQKSRRVSRLEKL